MWTHASRPSYNRLILSTVWVHAFPTAGDSQSIMRGLSVRNEGTHRTKQVSFQSEAELLTVCYLVTSDHKGSDSLFIAILDSGWCHFTLFLIRVELKKLRYSANNSATITIVIHILSQFSGIAELKHKNPPPKNTYYNTGHASSLSSRLGKTGLV